MEMLDYILGYQKLIISKEMVKLVVYNRKKYLIILSAFDEKFLEFVCNLHHIYEPLVAYINLNQILKIIAW
jgi:hypothetical protein